MKQPPGFEIPGSEHLVCHLRKSLYGLKQSPKTWYQEIDTYLRASGGASGRTRSMADPNLYFIHKDSHLLNLMLFVDYLLLTNLIALFLMVCFCISPITLRILSANTTWQAVDESLLL